MSEIGSSLFQLGIELDGWHLHMPHMHPYLLQTERAVHIAQTTCIFIEIRVVIFCEFLSLLST